MATTIYEKLQIELIFWKNGIKTPVGAKVMQLAGFCFVKVADNQSFVMPTPTNIRVSDTPGVYGGLNNVQITGIHVYERKAAIPQVQQNSGKFGCQFFGDV